MNAKLIIVGAAALMLAGSGSDPGERAASGA